MRERVLSGIAAMLLAACAAAPPPPAPAPPPPPPPPTPDQQFEALGQRYLREAQELTPVDATALGDHRFDDRLDDVSEAGWQARAAFDDKYLWALDGIDRASLSRANQVDALLLRHDLEYDRWRIQTLQDWRWNPLIYTRLAGDSVYTLLAREFAPAPDRLKNLGKRLDELPRFLGQVRDVLEPARVPKIHAETAVKQNAGKYLLLVTGGVSQADGGVYVMIGGRTSVDVLTSVAKDAAAIIAVGACAHYGSVQAARPNPTGAGGVRDVIKDKPIVNIAGCPPIADVVTATLVHYLTFGRLPQTDGEGRCPRELARAVRGPGRGFRNR